MITARRKMFGLQMGPPESRFNGKVCGFHTMALAPLLSHLQYTADDPFPDLESRPNSNTASCSKMEAEKSSSIQAAPGNPSLKVQKQTMPTPNPSPAVLWIRKKKRSRRRRRRKNKMNAACVQPPLRQRQISEAESEDSFIVFCNEDDGQCSSEVSDNETVITDDFDSSDSSLIPHKKVRFAEVLCEIHPMVMWSYAYQAARKGPWEECARDRDRFRNRILNIEKLIGPVLDAKHRSKIYENRFA